MENLPSTYVEGFHDLEAVKAMKYNTLGKTGLLVSELSYGGGPLGFHYGLYDENEAIEAIKQALRCGINYIDTAPWYGQGRSETVIGKALKDIPRQAYYLATKVGRYELNYEKMFDFSVDKTRKSFKNSLERLQVDYVDVIQVHDIEFAPSLNIIITQTLPELSRIVAQGKAKFIGITGYPISTLKECIQKSNINISCVLTYSRFTLIDNTLHEYLPFFKKLNIGVINGAALAMGLFTNQGPPEWHPADDEVKNVCQNAVKYCNDRNVDIARLAIWYSIQFGNVDTHLIGIQDLKQLKTNISLIIDGITTEEKENLSEIQEKYLKTIKGSHWETKEIMAYQAQIENTSK
ncbi:L-galactose dehydrogenase-like [Chelonus insularis]|uniref:L-galactose dehydrogenase-like n=1 Tax=Chelonus insularis TaxID=460826 RepID=UPI00158EBF8A|nr:L-galactose dehydrogenase-like [Chelonus insularis]